MFSFVNERKAVNALAALVSTTPASVTSATPVERAAALILSNVLLVVGSRTWGREVLHAPNRLPRQVAVDAVCVMADEHARLETAAAALDGRSINDPAVRALRWEVMANEVVTITIGVSLVEKGQASVRECWKALWGSNRSRDEALKVMAQYAKAYSIEPTPRIGGKRPSEDYLRKLGSALPPMFRPKQKTTR